MRELWTYADVWEAIADTVPDRIALRHGERSINWRAFERRAHALGAACLRDGLQLQDKVALYLYNGPEYMEAAFAAFKARLVPVNTNYRYLDDELHYLWTNADVAAVVFHGTFTARVEAIRARCADIRLWIHVDDGTAPCPDWALPYEKAVESSPATTLSGRSGEDLIVIYTGGTTGLPRGVMWRQHDLYMASNTTSDPPQPDMAGVRERLANTVAPPIGLSAAPLMHGTGFVFATTILHRGGTLVTSEERKFDAAALLDTIASKKVTDLCIVGDAFCRPIVESLESHPGRWELSSLKVVTSSGMVWSADVKQRLLAHAPGCLLIDFLNASEASGLGRSLTSKRAAGEESRFKPGANAFVIRDDGTPVSPGSGEIGRVAVRGHIPLGYYKDPVKSASTFPVINGVRCSVPGDYAMVEADGSITLLGRGSVSINTGGEKVFPEEVESALKTHPQVRDAVVVGVPDPRFGEVVAAVVEASAGETIDAGALITHVRDKVARHKAPRHVMPVASIGRGPNGKADYPGLRRQVVAWLDSKAQQQ
ncbi:MAG TPA: AMP-binding protein [Xanthobacteraceae bacterium]|nr:AMP-binding protein [Xanthobacteraceae bacterium]